MPRFVIFKWFAVMGALLFCPGRIAAADAAAPALWVARPWQTDDGLLDNNVTGVAQSPDGYLWVATLGGLMRFDGTKFEDFSREFSQLHFPDVQNRIVRKMFLDRRARLWLVMDRGSIIRVSQKSVRVFTQADGLEYPRVTAMAEDKDGSIWLACGSSLYRIQDEKISAFNSDDGLPPGNYTWVANDNEGTMWFVRGKHVGIFRAGEWKTLLKLEQAPMRLVAARDGGVWICTATEVLHFREGGDVKKCASLPQNISVSAMLEDRKGALWISTAADGVWRLEGESLEHVPTSHPEILCLTEDSEGNLWVGTGGGGLNLLRSQAIHLLGKEENLPGEAVRSICQAADGELWAAMNNGALARGQENQWRAVTAADGWPGGNAMCVAAARDGGVWIGTRDRGLQFFRDGKTTEWGSGQKPSIVMVRSLLLSSQGDLWIATSRPNQLLRMRNGKFEVMAMPQEVRSLRALAEGSDGTIWVGSSDGKLFRVQGLTLTNEPAMREERPISIRSLHATPDGSLWIGFAGWGIGRIWNGHYARLTTKDGLYDDYVSQILSDDQGSLWLTSNHGLFQLRQDELIAVTEGRGQRLHPIVHGKSEGLSNIQPTWDNSPAVCRTTQGQLLFATRNGLLAVQPQRIRDNPAPPPVILERVTVDDVTNALRDACSPLRGPAFTNCVDLSEPGAVLSLAPGHRKIEVVFTALSFSSPENTRFRYRLKNFDNEWIEGDVSRVAKYPQLAAGRYEFQVEACNSAGVWNEPGAKLQLEVAPFLWQTWPFRLGVLILFTASIAGLVRYFSFRRLQRKLERLEQQEALQKERTRIARDMHDEVGSKLSRLSLLSEMAGHRPGITAESRAEAGEISETARDTIRSFEQIVWAVNPKNDTLANLAHYLCRFAEELFDGSQVQCAFNLPAKIPDVMVSTEMRHHVFLGAKEALNNVLKHANATRVCVRLALLDDGFEIGIEDDGRGFTSAKPERAGAGNGLENMSARMKSVGGFFEIKSEPGSGTRVVLRVRCPKKNGN